MGYLVQAQRLNADATHKSFRIFIFCLTLECVLCFVLTMATARACTNQSINPSIDHLFTMIAFTIVDCSLLFAFIQMLPTEYRSIFVNHITLTAIAMIVGSFAITLHFVYFEDPACSDFLAMLWITACYIAIGC